MKKTVSQVKMSYVSKTNMTESVFFEKKYFTRKKKSFFKYVTRIQNTKDFLFEKGSFFKKKLSMQKQIRFFYGRVSESTFKKIIFYISKYTGNKNKNLIAFFEMRLQTFVYRINFASSIFHSKNLILSNTFFINGKSIKSPNYLLGYGDIVSFSVYKQAQYVEFFKIKEKKLRNVGFFKNSNYAITDYALGLSVVCAFPTIHQMQFPTYFIPKFVFRS